MTNKFVRQEIFFFVIQSRSLTAVNKWSTSKIGFYLKVVLTTSKEGGGGPGPPKTSFANSTLITAN